MSVIIVNSYTDVEFSFGNALNDDGIDDEATISLMLGVDDDDFTFTGWAKSAASGDVWASNLNSTFIFFNTTTTVTVKVGGTASAVFTIPTFTALWRMYTLTRISGVLHFYVNAVESTTLGITRAGQFGITHLSGHASPLAWTGPKTECYMNFGTGATQQDVTDIYNSRLGADPRDIVGPAEAYWKYNENGTDTTVIDETGNNDQTMLNYPASGMWILANIT